MNISRISVVNNQNQCQYGLQQCCTPAGYQCGMRFPPHSQARQPQQGQTVRKFNKFLVINFIFKAYGAHPWLGIIVTNPESNFIGTGALIDHQHVKFYLF